MIHSDVIVDPPDPVPAPVPQWTDELKAWIVTEVERWVEVMHLSHHHINVAFAIARKPDSPATAADTASNHPYESDHLITFYPGFINSEKDGKEVLSRMVLHEVTHIIMSPMKHLLHDVLMGEKFVTWREVRDKDETMTDRVANIVFELVSGKSTSASVSASELEGPHAG